MRQILIFFILLVTTSSTYCQIDNVEDCTFYHDTITNRKIYKTVDSMPEFDNKSNFLLHLVSTIQMDSVPEIIDTKGTVSFIVETNGKTTNIHIIDTINEQIDKRILDFIKSSNKWKCGYCNGTAVPVEMIITYRFDY